MFAVKQDIWRRTCLAAALIVAVVCFILLTHDSNRIVLLSRFKNICTLWGCETVSITTSSTSPTYNSQIISDPRVRHQNSLVPIGPKYVHYQQGRLAGASHLESQVPHDVRHSESQGLAHPSKTAAHHPDSRVITSSSSLKIRPVAALKHAEQEINTLKDVIRRQEALISQQATELQLVLNHGTRAGGSGRKISFLKQRVVPGVRSDKVTQRDAQTIAAR